MDINRFDYSLDSSLIAQKPSDRRDESKLLVVNRSTKTVSHHTFKDIPDILPKDSLLFRNNAKVFNARLNVKRINGGKAECFLLRQGKEGFNYWWCLLNPGKKLKPGSRFFLKDVCSADVLERTDSGEFLVKFSPTKDEGLSILDIAEEHGSIPLPPYIEAEKTAERNAADTERYQTVYANPEKRLAAAAPTAGLHFTNWLMADMRKEGFQFLDLTLNVGLGTFKPIKCDNIEDHPIHTESYSIEKSVFNNILEHNGKKRVAVGTTSVRAMEHAFREYQKNPELDTSNLNANIYLYPPTTIQSIDSLITNFHLPKSTLLCLVSAFLTPGSEDGIDWLKEIYTEAMKNEYRFYSYGDAMLIL